MKYGTGEGSTQTTADKCWHQNRKSIQRTIGVFVSVYSALSCALT